MSPGHLVPPPAAQVPAFFGRIENFIVFAALNRPCK
jgi:hypothetical protein